MALQSKTKMLIVIPMGKKHIIDWENIKITLVPANKEDPNPLNPYAKLTPKEREREIVSLCGRIWARAMKQKALANSNAQQNDT